MKKFAGDIVILHMCTKNHNHMLGIFPSTFLQPLNGSKNSILNGVTKLNLLMFFFFFVFETPLKDFPFYSTILLTLWFRYLQTCMKET